MGLEDIGLVGRNKGFSKETPLPKRTDRNDRGCEGEREDWHTALPTKSSKKEERGEDETQFGKGLLCSSVPPTPVRPVCRHVGRKKGDKCSSFCRLDGRSRRLFSKKTLGPSSPHRVTTALFQTLVNKCYYPSFSLRNSRSVFILSPIALTSFQKLLFSLDVSLAQNGHSLMAPLSSII